MTLRDCTLFVQVPRELISEETSCGSPAHDAAGSGAMVNGDNKHTSQNRGIRIVIADLDEKSEVNRGHYWQSLEEELISEGYYLGKGKLDITAEDCDLSDSLWKES